MFDGKQMYCLQQTNSHLTKQGDPGFVGSKTDNIPLVDFSDIDRDGMIDMVFLHENQIYVYYNMLESLSLSGKWQEPPKLCKKWNDTESGPIFANFTNDLLDHTGGNEFVVI